MRRNALAALAAARAVGVEPDGLIEVALSARARPAASSFAGGIVVVDDCYNANPMSMRAALDDLAASASGRRVAVLGDMLELGPDEVRFHAEIGAHARDAGVDVLVAVGPRAAHMADGYGEVDRRARRERRRRASAACCARATPCCSRARAASGSRSSREALEGADGRGPHRRHRRAAICMFLAPRFIEALRNREFGQFIREEGPEGHHVKAGTPTMGGIIIFTAFSVRS